MIWKSYDSGWQEGGLAHSRIGMGVQNRVCTFENDFGIIELGIETFQSGAINYNFREQRKSDAIWKELKMNIARYLGKGDRYASDYVTIFPLSPKNLKDIIEKQLNFIEKNEKSYLGEAYKERLKRIKKERANIQRKQTMEEKAKRR